MAKIIKYQLAIEVPHYVEIEVPIWSDEEQETIITTEIREETKLDFYNVSVTCSTQQEYNTNLPTVEKEAYNGEYTVEGEFDSEPTEPTTDEILNVLLGVSE